MRSHGRPRRLGASVPAASATRALAAALAPAARDLGSAAPAAPVTPPASAPSAARPAPPRPAPVAPDPTRIAAIVGHVEAIGRAQLAQHLAYQTAMTVGAAVALMRASARDGSPLAAAYQAAATTRAARGLPADPEADRRVALGVAAALSNGSPAAGLQLSPAPDHDSFTTDYEEGRRAAAALLGKHL